MATNKRIIRSNDEAAAGGASFQTVLYTGTAPTTKVVTGVGFQPDLVWTKSIENAYDNNVVDSVRGLGDNVLRALSTNLTEAENTTTSNNILSLDSDGFTVQGSGSRTNSPDQDYVAWCWKAAGYANTFNVLENGSTTSSATAAGAGITAGSITNGWSVSANRDAGFSVVSYLGNYTANQSVGHGLNKTPDVLIVKPRGQVSSWPVWHKDLTSADYSLELETTDAEASVPSRFGALPTSSVFKIGSSGFTNALAPDNEMIAYCFAEVAGFSKFGSYTGNGNVNGPTIDCGFEPAFVMIKASSAVSFDRGHWVMKDNKRDTTNPNSANLYANLSNAEDTASVADVNFLSNGFQPAGTYQGINESGKTYIYMAFANQF